MALQLLPIHFLNVFEEVLRRREQRIRRRMLRDTSNPFTMPQSLFIKMYRIPIAIVQQVLIPQIEPHIRVAIRITYIPVHVRVLAALHLLTQGDYQSTVGADCYIAVAQSTASKIIHEVIVIIATYLFPRYVKFPTSQDQIQNIKQGFLDKFNFPNVKGAIDCTHIAILSPPINDPVQPAIAYFNRKGYYSLNVQAICDSNLLFLAVNARFPGATHDAAIWASSTVKRYLERKFEEGDTESWLLGDSGYPLSPYVMTPIAGVEGDEDSPEGRYNYWHVRARNAIERCFGVLKQRFRCLLKHRVLHYNHRKAGLMVYACVTLHNVLIMNNVEYDDGEEEGESSDESSDDDDDAPADANGNPDILAAGRNARNRIIRLHF